MHWTRVRGNRETGAVEGSDVAAYALTAIDSGEDREVEFVAGGG